MTFGTEPRADAPYMRSEVILYMTASAASQKIADGSAAAAECRATRLLRPAERRFSIGRVQHSLCLRSRDDASSSSQAAGVAASPGGLVRLAYRSSCFGADLYSCLVLAPSQTHAVEATFSFVFSPPNKAPEPTLTVRPFSLMTAALKTPSSLWVSVAHL